MKYKTEFSFNKAIVVDANMLLEMQRIAKFVVDGYKEREIL